MNVVFNIETYETYKIIVSLFHDEQLDIEKEKGYLDQFARKRKLCKNNWQATSRITTFRPEFNYSVVLLDREFRCVTSFEFERQPQPSDETNLHNKITID